MDANLIGDVRAVVREISATAKALRLYPSTSPIPQQSASTAVSALAHIFDTLPVLSFAITKGGFAFSGQGLEQATASADLAGILQQHGVAEVSFLPGCDAEQLVAFLGICVREPEDVRNEGGMGLMLARAGVQCVSISDVQLTVVDGPTVEETDDVDEFLRELARDPERLATWLASATQGDPVTLQESLAELARSAGSQGASELMEALAQAFRAQNSGGRDALLGLALDPGPAHELAQGMLSRLTSTDVADSLCQGLYGKNMLSLSTAMTSLPIGERFQAVMAQVRELLPEFGHGARETEFLDHMIEVRRNPIPEAALASRETSYLEIAERATVDDQEIASAKAELADSDAFARRRKVGTLVSLLDQQKDFRLYCQTLDSLAALVPRLLESGEVALAHDALSEIAGRETRADLPWPEVADRLRQARDRATSGRAMNHILQAVSSGVATSSEARDLMLVAGDAAPQALLEAALSERGFDALAIAEEILGRRMNDLLPGMAARAQWFQVAGLAGRLADQADQRSKQALEMLVARTDNQSRREVAKGLAASASPSALKPLGTLLRDTSAEVAATAARALAASPAPGAATVVANRLAELDIDGKDFLLAREIIWALAPMRDPGATDVLEKLAGRRSLIKRGQFSQVQTLAKRALAARRSGDAR